MSGDPRFGAVVRARRELAGISQRELAQAAGLAASTVRRLESGARDPRLTTMWAVAEALGTRASVLVAAAYPDEGPTAKR